MKREIFGQGINGSTTKPKPFVLSAALVGALTGIFAALLLSLLYRAIGFDALALGFLYPGYLVVEKLNSLNITTSGLPNYLIHYGVSCIPPAVIGAMIFSDKVTLRISGVMLLVLYATSWMFFSFFFHIMAD